MARSLTLVEQDPPTPAMKRALAMETYAECRTIGHAWERFEPDDKRPPQFGVRLSFRCMRGCGTERHDLVKRMDGSVLGRGYDYEDDYSMSAAESLSKDQWRRRYVKLGDASIHRVKSTKKVKGRRVG